MRKQRERGRRRGDKRDERNKQKKIDRGALMMIYRVVIRSAIDYECTAYGTAVSSVLKTLDVVQAKALRICGEAFRTTPIKYSFN